MKIVNPKLMCHTSVAGIVGGIAEKHLEGEEEGGGGGGGDICVERVQSLVCRLSLRDD